jgi:hypothetical protein
VLAEAFGQARAKPTAWDLGEAYSDHRGVVDSPTLNALCEALGSLVEQNDPSRLQKWMALLTVAERRAVHALLVTA